jgi:hypothetical protein
VEAAATTARQGWTFAQRAVLVLAVVNVLWALAGLIANPDFATGDGAPVERVLGVDFNGWHAVSGFLLFAPAFVAVLRPDWAVIYAFAAGAALVLSGIWIFIDPNVLFILNLPEQTVDGIFHVGWGVVFLGVGAVQLALDRPG